MTHPMGIHRVAKRIGVSPRQFLVISAGAVSGGGAVIASSLSWSLGRDIGIAGSLTAVLLILIMLLRSISLSARSIRRDILRLGQRQQAASNRIEASTGLGHTSGLSSFNDPIMGNSLGHAGKYFGVGPEYEYAFRAAQNPSSFETFALRTKSVSMRDVFARVATGMQFGYTDLIRMARTSRAVPVLDLESVIAKWQPKGLLTLARIIANQRIRPEDPATAILLFELASRVFGIDALGKTDRRLLLEALVDEGKVADAERLVGEFRLKDIDPVQAALLTANLRRQEDKDSESPWARCLGEVNTVLGRDGARPISIRPGKAAALDRLSAAVAPHHLTGKKKGPLVSVIMPTHNGSDLIVTALLSLKNQTWKNIEIFVVDDCSGSLHVSRLREICSLYDNVTLLELSQNHGAYVARNFALNFIAGEFVTVHDDDDWSHPEKIERQATALVSNASAVANMSMHSRITDDLVFLRVNNNTNYVQPNYSSIMFRRRVLDDIGVWDTVNRGADAEFRDRLNSFYANPVEIIGTAPMSFTRTRVGSLTHGELDRGYIEPARLVYLDSYTQAHRRGLSAGKSQDRAFAVPLDMMPELRGKHKGQFDVVFATDFRFPGGTTSLTLEEIRAAAELNLRVGIVQLDSPLNKPGTGMSPGLLDMLLAGSASLLRLADQYQAELMIIRHPSVVQFLDNATSPAEIGSCFLIANTAPVLAGGAGSVYDLEDCVQNITRCFAVNPTVVPESGVTRQLVQEVIGSARLAGFDWPGFVMMQPEVERASPGHQARPIVGRHSRDSRLKWPDTLEDFVSAYAQPDVFTTHLLGGIDSISASIPREIRQRLKVTPFGEADVRTYLKTIDFWVYYHSSSTVESFGMAIAEAMEAGCVVILPPYMSVTFGHGALYAEPSQVATTISRYWNDPALYFEQSLRGREYVQNRYSKVAYKRRLQDTLEALKKVDSSHQMNVSQ